MTESPAPPEQQPLPPGQPASLLARVLKKLLRRVENILFGVLMLLLGVYFVLQLPSVQNWLVHKTTTYLSNELGTRVELKRVDIEFFDNVVLDGLYVQDLNGDTLLYAEKFNAGLSGNFFSILWNRLEFSEISLSHARINLRKQADQRRGNLNELLVRIGELFGTSPSTKKKKSAPFSVKVQNLNLTDVAFTEERFSYKDGEIRSKLMSFEVAEGNVKINNIDLANNLIEVRSLSFNGFHFGFEKDSRNAPPGFVPYVKPVALKTDTMHLPEPLRIAVGQLSLQNSGFHYDNFRSSATREGPPEVMDYDHLNVGDINGQAEKVEIYVGEKPAVDGNGNPTTEDIMDIFATIKHLAARESCGFALSHGEARRLMLTDSISALYGAKIESAGGSSLGDTLMFRYDDTREDDPWTDQLGEFNDRVTMDIRLAAGSKIRLGDVRHFEETVFSNEFFTANKDLVADIAGNVSGKVNGKLKAGDFDIRVGNSTRMQGDFDGRGLGDNDEPMVLNFEFKELLTDMNTIARVVPGFRPPKQFFKLDRISFEGNYQLFDGFDHVLYGKFSTSLGPGKLDMQLNLKDGPEKAIYRGNLKMRGFDMARWTGNSNFGPSSFVVDVAENSTGLTLSTVNARVTGKVDTFFYNHYPYRDITLNGKFEKYVFDGKVVSNDPNVDFAFDGNINLKDSIPLFDFSARIHRLELQKLQLTSQDWVLMGDIKQLQLRGRNIDEIVGSAAVHNFKILENREEYYNIDYLNFNSYFRPDGTRFFGFDSDVATGQMTGEFSIARAPKNLLRLIGKYHPIFVEKLGFATNDSLPLTDRYDLAFQVRNSRNLAQLFVPGLDTLRNVSAKANVDARRGTSYLVLEAPLVRFGNTEFRDPSLRWNSDGDSAWLYLRLPDNHAGKKSKLPAISLGGPLVGDVFHLKLEAKDEKPNSIVESVYLDGDLSVVDSLWQLRFNASKIKLFSQEWLIEEDNFIRFGKNYLETRQLELFNGIRRIALESKNNGRGLVFGLTNFDLSEANRLLNPDQIQIHGKAYDFEISVNDIFLMQGIEIGFLSDNVFINDKPYGEMLSNFEIKDLSKPLMGKIFLFDKKSKFQKLRVAGAYLMGGEEEEGGEQPVDNMEGLTLRPNEFVADITADSFPFEVIQTIVPEISETAGLFSANLQAKGDLEHPTVLGSLLIKQGQFQIDYLKTLFHIKNQPISFTKNKISADGDTIYDTKREHFALVFGGLEHEYFDKWRINCRVLSRDPGFLVMNTNSTDSDLYYGRAEGSFDALFSGSFSRTNIAIEATTGPGTRLYIPLYSSADAAETQFINFEKNKPKAESRKDKSFVITDLKGLNFEMDLSVTEQAEVQLIFDEQTGDIIKGRGEGNIRLGINREGEFTMYGGYQIVRGEYLFTLLNFVNKPFVVTQGGTINWYGDPYGARINLDATYEVNTSVYNFVKEELELLGSARPRLLEEAAKATRVTVNMNLAGDLLKPNITFGLSFANISSELKSLTDTKLRLLRQDQAELSRQVFGLVVIGSFLPPSNGGFIQSSDYVATAFNTLTQMISNQFSNYLAGLASEWFGGAVSSLDFDIVYSDYQNDVLSDRGREVNVRLSSGFINDRVTVQVGSQFGIGRTGLTTSEGFLGEDVTVQIMLTENRQWRMKVYQRTEPDISGQRGLRFGLGLSFQKDYDTFEDMWRSFGRAFTRRKHG